jgi:hypothetical protein
VVSLGAGSSSTISSVQSRSSPPTLNIVGGPVGVLSKSHQLLQFVCHSRFRCHLVLVQVFYV